MGHVEGRITSESLRIGGKLPTESALMETLDASRMMIHRAISHLQAKGLIEACYSIGSLVLPPRIGNSIPLGDAPAMHEILNMLGLRVATETECAGLVAQRISATEIETLCLAFEVIEQDQAGGNDSATSDLQFHLSITCVTGSEHLVGTLAQLGKTLIPRMRMGLVQVGYLNAPELRATVDREHHSVFEAITRGGPEATRAAMHVHLSNSRERLRRAYEAAGTRTTATGS